jgi:chromosome partitioning protein
VRRVAFINEKGGTCKTTLCVNVAAWLAGRRGLRVLVADLDTQGHAGKSLGVDVRGLSPTIRDLLLGTAPLEAVVQTTAVPNLDLLPANKELATLPVDAATREDRADLLRGVLEGAPPDRWDVCLVDSPPSLSLITENVLRAADEVVIPVALTYLALDGCAEIAATIERMQAELGFAPRISMVVPALYRKTQLADEILAKLRARFPGEVSRSVLGYSVKIDEAQSHGLTIFEHSPSCSGAGAIASIAEELLARDPAAAARPARTA